jgi:hypothetical protein
MSSPAAPEVVVPITGVIARPPWPPGLEEALAALLGPCVLRSDRWGFDATRYYEEEMGPGLERSFLAHAPQPAADLAAVKLATHVLESRWSQGGARRVNLDPGYVGLGGLFLASCKPGPHRVHLSRGVYAELTLWYRHGWTPLPWTFPDFRTPRYQPFLDACRALLKESLRRESPPSPIRDTPPGTATRGPGGR